MVVYGLLLVFPFGFYKLMSTRPVWYVYPSLLGLSMLVGYAYQVLVPRLWQKPSGRLALGCYLGVFAVAMVIDPQISQSLTQRNEHTRSIFAQVSVAQSWLLEGDFCGYQHRHGGYQEFETNNNGTLFLVYNAEPEELNLFLSQHIDLHIICVYENHALLARSELGYLGGSTVWRGWQ